LIDDDTFVLAGTADTCFMVHLVYLFMKTHLLALLQDNYLDLVRCAFLRNLSGCVRNVTAFCQHLLRPMKSAILADTGIICETQILAQYISLSLVVSCITAMYLSRTVTCSKPN